VTGISGDGQTDWLARMAARPGIRLLLIALVTVACRMVYFGDQAADFDEQIYSIIGQNMLRGSLPYVDIWDRKSVGLFAIFAAAHAIGGPDALAYQLLATMCAMAGAWLLFPIAQKLVDDGTALGAALLYPPLTFLYGARSAQAEIFFIPLMIAMFWLVTTLDKGQAERRGLLAMLLGGIALQIKFTVAPQCVVLGLVALWHFRGDSFPRQVARAVLYGLIGAAPTLVVLGWYAAIGQFDALWYATVLSNFDRRPSGGGRFMAEHLAPLGPLVVLTLAGVYAAFRMNPPQDKDYYRLVLLWSAATLAGVYLPGTLYIHYFNAFVPCAILLALPLLDRRVRMGWLVLPATFLAVILLVNFPHRLEQTRESRTSLAAMASAIRPHVNGADRCLLVYDGPTALYRLTGACLPSRIVYPDHWNNALERGALGLDRVAELRRVLAARPGAIVTNDDPVTEQDADTQAMIRAALAAHYRQAEVRVINNKTHRVWVLAE
jgi:hypothetical protein